jgi:hypothetical protein
MAFELRVLAESAWAPSLEGPEAWRAWASGAAVSAPSEAAPDLPFLPSLFKRRLGQLDRMVLMTGHEALGGASPRRVVLATRRGEIGQQCRISESLAESGEVSPSAFSLSVFNAPASLLAIAEKNAGAACAIHAGEHSFAAGLACCIGMLAADPEPVLLVAADELLPEAYGELEGERGPCYALALLLGPGGSGGEGELVVDASAREARVSEPEALAFLRWLLAGSGELGLGGSEMPLVVSRSPSSARGSLGAPR